MKIKFTKFSLLFFILSAFIVLNACDEDDDSTISKEELIGDYYQLIDNDYTGTLAFIDSNTGVEYFIDDTVYGEANFNYSIDGNTLTLTYTQVTDSYQVYNEISAGTTISAGIKESNNQLIIDYEDVKYTYDKITGITDEVFGSWKYSNGDYTDIITFTTNYQGIESFTTEQDTGSGQFVFQIKGGNNMYMTYSIFYGDYKEYNEISGDLHNYVTIISIEDNQLTFKYRGENYVYTKINDDNTIDFSDLKGTWKMVNGTYTDIISFYNEDDQFTSYDNYGIETFIDEAETGMATFFWMVHANLVILDYSAGGYMCGDFESYNGISPSQSILTEASISGDELTFHYQGDDFVYTRLTDEDIIEKSDLAGTWAIQIDDYADTLELTYSDATYFFTDGFEKFSTTTQSGTADFSWFINGNIFSSWYFTLTGDYEAYNGISEHDFISNYISISGNQLTFEYEGEDFVYTKVTE